MARAYGEVNAAPSPEFTRLVVSVHNSIAFEDENGFFIGMVVNRCFARRNPSRELGDLLAPKIGIDQVAEQTILSGANVLAKVLMDLQPWRLAGPCLRRTIDDVTLCVL